MLSFGEAGKLASQSNFFVSLPLLSRFILGSTLVSINEAYKTGMVEDLEPVSFLGTAPSYEWPEYSVGLTMA